MTSEPDEWHRWIDDPTHPDYHSPRAQDLRARRAYALAQVQSWMSRIERDGQGEP